MSNVTNGVAISSAPGQQRPYSDVSESGRSLARAAHLDLLALGAITLGTQAIGAVLSEDSIGRARIRRLEIDELAVRRLRVTDEL